MKRNLIFILVACLSLTISGQNARDVLDKTAAAFRKAGGVETTFRIKVYSNDELSGQASGNISVKGDKFYMETPENITWYDGETQWTYLTGSDEVNISNPTEEELQEINPYALLNMYQQGYNYALGKNRTYQGKAVTEVILTAKDKKKDIERIALYVNNKFEPVYIEAELRDGSRNEIVIETYKTGQKYENSRFIFDAKKYPDAEIIDMR